MKPFIFVFFMVLIFLMLPLLGFANNVQIENVSLTGQNTNQDYYMIEFDISWENSWRTSTFESNWDAVWVFVKFSPKNHRDWHHAALHYVDGFSDGHTAPPGATIQTMVNNYGPSNGVGVMIYRSSDGIGNIGWQNVQLRWDYGADGIADDQLVELSVFAIEMVYVPQGAFYVGDGNLNTLRLEAGNTGEPFLISSEAAITLGGTDPSHLSNVDNGGSTNDDFNYSTTKTLPANFPKGYDAFYCMKYEASQQMFADFIGHLNQDQFPTRATGLIISEMEFGSKYAIANHPTRAMGGLAWTDIAAYLDWAGLRPLSELEYEKACRGPLYPVAKEFAWGNSSYANFQSYILENEGEANESIVAGMGEHTGNFNRLAFLEGLFRNGIFAASAHNKTREETGATYWGIMEMSGNAFELTLSIGNPSTRGYKGWHGDGTLQPNGEASVNMFFDWAPITAVGTGYRDEEVSRRNEANMIIDTQLPTMGIRGIRSAQ